MTETTPAAQNSTEDPGTELRAQVGTSERVWKVIGPTRPVGIAILLCLTTIASLLARQQGVLGALAFWHWHRDLPLHVDAVWLTLVLATQATFLGVDSSFRKRKDQKAEAEQARLEEQISQVERNQHTLPPIDVVDGIVEAMDAVHRAELLLLRAPTSEITVDSLHETVRSALSAVTSLVQRHDRIGRRASRTIEYSANIMVFVEASKLDAQTISDLEKNNLFKSDGLSLDRIPGVLHLWRDWTVSTSTPDGRDSRVNELVLQLPEEYAEERDLLALPGAPSAWCARRIDICPNVTEIPKRLQSEGTGTRRQADAIRKYFESAAAKHIRSFISIHLPPVPGSIDDRPTGVVNVNCSETGLFNDEARRELVLPFLRALMDPLAVIVDSARRRAARYPSDRLAPADATTNKGARRGTSHRGAGRA